VVSGRPVEAREWDVIVLNGDELGLKGVLGLGF